MWKSDRQMERLRTDGPWSLIAPTLCVEIMISEYEQGIFGITLCNKLEKATLANPDLHKMNTWKCG